MKKTIDIEKDVASLFGDSKRTPEVNLSEKLKNPWVSASDIAGLPDVPTTARRARDLLSKATADKPSLKRRKEGTKATVYHASVLPLQTIQYLLSKESSHGECKENDVNYSAGKDNNYQKHVEYSLTDFLDEFALIPGYDVQVSTGNGTSALDERQPCRHLAFRRKWLSYRGFNEKDLLLVWAKGDSMEPTISNNDTLVVNTALTKPVDGHIYVIRQDDTLWAKRVQVQPGAWLLISDNKAVYPPIEIKREDMANFEVIGQVVHISKDVGI
ncbi:S24 family peptidase [Brenneria goodwinii]|uniref:S24 family peptidase n=1 Tax=Brenneria goodwinii TaxID=1109412 RepID=UPI001C7DA9D0|nr:S24 family peptidase [Brenneria goodwinii]